MDNPNHHRLAGGAKHLQCERGLLRGFAFTKRRMELNGIWQWIRWDVRSSRIAKCANVSDHARLIEMLTHNIEYLRAKPITPKITILLARGYHPEHLTQEQELVYPQIMRKIKFERSTKPSKQEKSEQGKSGFVRCSSKVGN